MKFTVRKKDLLAELALCQGVVESKTTIPILSHLLMRADQEGLQLLSTDLEIGLHARCTADVTVPGAVSVPAKKLHEVVRALDCETISFESEANDWVRIEGGSFKSRIVGLPEADFPKQPGFPESVPTIRVPLTAFQEMISRIVFAVTTENTRFSINGALLEIAEGKLTLVATDGHRLAHVSRPLELSDDAPPTTVLVPRKALIELNRVKAVDENAEIDVAAADNHVFFRTQGRVLYSRTLEGSFPSYQKVIPAENDISATINREAFAGMLARVAILTNEASKMVTVALADGSLSISTNNPSMGEASESLPVAQEGGEVKIGLNHEYLLNFLQVISCETVELKLKDSSTQGLLTPKDSNGCSYQYVVMPMRLS